MRLFSTIVIAALLCPFGDMLTGQTWDGGGADNNIFTANNWNPNAAPANDGTASLVFGGTTRLGVNVNVAGNFNSLTFNNTAGAFTFSGSALTVQGGGIVNNDANLQTFSTAMALGASQAWNAASGNLLFSGTVDLSGNTLTLSGSNAKTLTGQINGLSSAISITGSGSTSITGNVYGNAVLTKAGSGTLTFSGGNALQLQATIQEGLAVLDRSDEDAFNSGSLTVGGGSNAATVRLVNNSNQINDNIYVSVLEHGTLDLNNLNEDIYRLYLTGGTVTTGTGTLTIPNSFSDPRIVTSASSTTSLISGKMELDPFRSEFQVADGAAAVDLEISAVISGSGARVEKTGAGTLKLSGNNTFTTSGDYSNPAWTLSGGVVEISSEANLGNSANNVQFNGGTLRVNGSFTSSSAKQYRLGAAGGTIEVTSGNTLTINTADRLRDSGALTKKGAGTLQISASQSTYTGNIDVNGGTLLLGASNVISSSSNLTLSGGTFATGGFSETLGTLTLTANSIINLGGGSSILHFANSSGVAWTAGAILSIYNWSGTAVTGGGTDQLYFGTGLTGLTSSQLSQIYFYSNNGTTFLGTGIWATSHNGEVVVPEPEVNLTLALLLGLISWRERRHLLKLAGKLRGSRS